MRFLIDMNLSPRWIPVLQSEGWDAVHWCQIGSFNAPDADLMAWALAEQRIVLTNDLDFGAILAATNSNAPSVVQVRNQDHRPETLAPLLISLLRTHEAELLAGALLIADQTRSRVRMLPLRRA